MTPGDLVFVHANHLASKLIRFGQRLRFRGERRRYAWPNHVAVVVGESGEIVEALTSGLARGHVSKYARTPHVVFSSHVEPLDQREIRVFAESVLKARETYGWATIASLAFTQLTGSKFVVGRVGTAICSGFAAECLTRAGEVFERPPAYNTPADLAEHFEVTGP